jgi:hypothetical protein
MANQVEDLVVVFIFCRSFNDKLAETRFERFAVFVQSSPFFAMCFVIKCLLRTLRQVKVAGKYEKN